ncbi:MAG TPA: cellulase family glycosylhydrolase [Abditibacterium sp.]|jgi:hypothetical protein
MKNSVSSRGLSLALCAGAVSSFGFSISACAQSQPRVGISRPMPPTRPRRAVTARPAAPVRFAPASTRSFAKIELAFVLPPLAEPFDFEKNDVRAQILLPQGQILSLPAFYDGDNTWRVRHTPGAAGSYRVTGITLNGKIVPTSASAFTWNVAGAAQPGFVRIDPKNPRRFSFDNGARYYPLGHNVAWKNGGDPPIPTMFGRMGAAGENWSRVWMNHWDNKNLDWPLPTGGKLGDLDLGVARRWDEVVESAAKNGIYFQLVTQHHGQYSANVNPNWADNPYNVANGGFLSTPTEFFTNERAKALTKRKLRYMVARYGYNPHVLAWELWNEVQFSDAGRAPNWAIVAAWHREMAAFVRAQDAYRHLLTTSSEVPPEVYAPVDYYQRHTYPSSVIATLSQLNFVGAEWPAKPQFTGEFGSDRAPEWTMHSGMWAGIASDAAGAAQYWYWDRVEQGNYYRHFAAASGFLKASDFAARDAKNNLKPAFLKIATPQSGPLVLSPGGGWGKAEKTNFDLSNPADVAAFGRAPGFLQGQNHRELNPAPFTFRINVPQAATLQVRLAQVARAGANVKITAGGQTREFPFPAAAADSSEERTLAVPLGAGAQVISMENTGTDWVVVRDISIPGAAMLLDGAAKAAPDYALAWIFNRQNIEEAAPTSSSTGTATIPGVGAGRYRVTWWDTLAGKPLKTEVATADAMGLKLQIPAVTRDIAVWAQKQ